MIIIFAQKITYKFTWPHTIIQNSNVQIENLILVNFNICPYEKCMHSFHIICVYKIYHFNTHSRVLIRDKRNKDYQRAGKKTSEKSKKVKNKKQNMEKEFQNEKRNDLYKTIIELLQLNIKICVALLFYKQNIYIQTLFTPF